jgi:hypothetical protein
LYNNPKAPAELFIAFFRYLAVAEAADEMIVNQAGGLHEGVTDGRTDETEAAFLQILAHGV